MLGAAACLAAGLAGCVVAPRPAPYGGRPPPAARAPTGVALYFYPSRGQPEAQQERDRYECYRWAVAQTGVDPGMTPVRRAPAYAPPGPSGAEVIGGAATGAVVGAAVSSPRHAGEGAVLGAFFGALLGAAQADARQREADAAAERYASRAAAGVPASFGRAMSACMEGRGYRVR